jgi:hypothetical protein
MWANFQRIVEVFTQKIFNVLSNIRVWDPGSGIRDPGSRKYLFQIPDPGVKKAPDPGSLIRNTELFNSLMWICDPGWKKSGSGIRDEH